METLQAIRERRSIKHYDPAHRMSEEEIRTLFEHVILSPTSFNMQNWRFVAVTDPELRRQLREAAWDQSQVTDASIVVFLCADKKAWARDPQRYWRNAPESVQEALVPMIKQLYEGNEALQHDEAIRSCGIAAQTLMLAAKDMGYDTCPMVGFDSAKTAKLINLPQDHEIVLMVVVGKALRPATERGGQLPLDEVLIRDRF